MTQEQLGELAHIHPKYISEIERGIKCPTLNIIYQLANALNTTAIALITCCNFAMEQSTDYYIESKKN